MWGGGLRAKRAARWGDGIAQFSLLKRVDLGSSKCPEYPVPNYVRLFRAPPPPPRDTATRTQLVASRLGEAADPAQMMCGA